MGRTRVDRACALLEGGGGSGVRRYGGDDICGIEG